MAAGNLKYDSALKSTMYSYNDYFLTGANCIVYFASDREDEDSYTNTRKLSNIPVLGVGYNIQQSKAPLYGYNDVGVRKIMAGQRIVSGEFVILHKWCGFLEEVLMRNDSIGYGATYELDLKEQLRIKYWNTRDWDKIPDDPQRINFPAGNRKNIFYSHPNFDISIVYGVGDEVGRPTQNPDGYLDISNVLNLKSSWYGDESLSHKDINPLWISKTMFDEHSRRETISGVQLTGKTKSVSIDGEVITESYSFLAVDVLNQ